MRIRGGKKKGGREKKGPSSKRGGGEKKIVETHSGRGGKEGRGGGGEGGILAFQFHSGGTDDLSLVPGKGEKEKEGKERILLWVKGKGVFL